MLVYSSATKYITNPNDNGVDLTPIFHGLTAPIEHYTDHKSLCAVLRYKHSGYLGALCETDFCYHMPRKPQVSCLSLNSLSTLLHKLVKNVSSFYLL